MAVISVCSTKGGVGTTTLVICLADAFARQGGSVAIVDADPNGHVGAWRERAGTTLISGALCLAGLLALLFGVAVGAGVPHWLIGYFIRRRVARFTAKFPDAIELLVRGLRSGLPVTETIGVVGNEVEGPVGDIDHVTDPAASFRAGTGLPLFPAGPQVRGELTSESALGLHVERLIDRFVTDSHRHIVGELLDQHQRDEFR